MPSLPADVVAFARTFIRSLEDLHVFIVCADHHERWWDAEGVARRALISEARATRSLERLARSNLLDVRVSEALRYRFHPGNDELAARAAVFASACRRNPTDIVKLVARSDIPDSVRDFADAFRIKRNDNG